MNDSIQLIDTLAQSIITVEQTNTPTLCIWKWLAFSFFILCHIELCVIFKQSVLKRKVPVIPFDNLRTQVKSEEPVDFANIMNSAFLSADLYDKLKIKCHPDRFATDPHKQIIADNLFQRIIQNKANYKVLIQLKQEAEDSLGITI